MKTSQRKRLNRIAQKLPEKRGMNEHGTREGGLLNVCEVLNSHRKTERAQAFIRLFAQWREAKSLAAMLGANPGLWGDLSRAILPPVFEPSKKGKSGKYVVTPSAPLEDDPESFAIWLFAHLVTNPLCEDLAGPCDRCGDYYVKKRVSQKKYCSRRCGRIATAKSSNIDKLEREREEKLHRARTHIRAWESLKRPPKKDWKEWINSRDNTITTNWLTRAVNATKGYGLQPPVKGISHA
jgi:hypothetical protein